MLDFDLAALYGVTVGKLEPGGAPEPVAFSERLYLSADRGRKREF